jgi:acyl-CoA synthetase (AMP-forming)/AMP-acid ligase II
MRVCGGLAVPVAPPGRRDGARFRAIADACRPAAILSRANPRRGSARRGLSADSADAAGVDRHRGSQRGSRGGLAPAGCRGASPAFLQFTSGSTASPRGVIVNHASLLLNQARMREAFGTSLQSRILGWLPLHHDMGLIGTVLHPVFMGVPCVLMSPVHFVERPLRWLQAISRFGATISGGPNFAFDLCVRRASAAECQALDLSGWEVAFNGAEPVRPERFAGLSVRADGFKPEAFHPCYGLAEAPLRRRTRVVRHGRDRHLRSPLEQGTPAVIRRVRRRTGAHCLRAWCASEQLGRPADQRRACAAGEAGEICLRDLRGVRLLEPAR